MPQEVVHGGPETNPVCLNVLLLSHDIYLLSGVNS
jgi:hypothetical protein